jgi:hypothetical protein
MFIDFSQVADEERYRNFLENKELYTPEEFNRYMGEFVKTIDEFEVELFYH